MTVIRNDYLLGGQEYPFLSGLDWKIVTTHYDRKNLPDLLVIHPEVSLRWVKDSHVSDLYVTGMNTEALLKHLGLTLRMNKGGFVLSKRLSRIMRPFFFWDFPDHLDVFHDPTLDKKKWDSMGKIHRRVLPSLLRHLPPAKAEKLTRQLLQSRRLELTLTGPWGEDKGHVMVVDDLDHDVVLTDDSKQELFTERVFIGVKPVDAKDYRYIDSQSITNLHPFLREVHYAQWLETEGKRFIDSLNNGQWTRMASRLSFKQRQAWWVMEYLAHGWDYHWFQGTVKALATIHTVKVGTRGRRMKLPIPGAYYYIGLDIHSGYTIPQGHISLGKQEGTAYISEHDWDYLSSRSGGPDFDDAYTLLGFTDYDGQKQVLIWRSPNSVGEFTLFKPFGRFPKAWTWPALDSRELPVMPKVEYLNLIDPPVIEDRPYSVSGMSKSLLSAQANIGEPGATVNLHMVYKAQMGTLPSVMAIDIESLMDSVAKNGALLTRVKAWNRSFITEHIRKHPEVPSSMVRRIWNTMSPESRDLIVPTEDHWVESLLRMVEDHLKRFEAQVQKIADEAMPPASVLTYGKDHLEAAAKVRTAYAKALVVQPPIKDDTHWDAVKLATEKALWEYPTDQWTRIMAAVALRTYVVSDTVSTDSVMWQIGRSNGEKQPRKRGIVHVTLKMLEEVNPKDNAAVPVVINGPWFSITKALRQKQGKKNPTHMGEIPKAEADAVKTLVAEWAAEGRFNQLLTVKLVVEKGEQRAQVYRNGHLLGYIRRGQEGRVEDLFEPAIAQAVDGNLYVAIAREETR